MRSKFYSVLLVIGMLVSSWVAIAVPSFAEVEGSDGLPLHWTVEGQPVTVETRFTFPETDRDVVGVWLAGVAAEAGGPPAALSLVWSEQDSGLIPAWGLQLQSDAGLLPKDMPTRRGQGMLAGSEFVNLRTFVKPDRGHTYVTRFSYDPVSGALSLWIQDETTGAEVLNQQLIAVPTSATLYPSAGALDPSGAFLPMPSLQAHQSLIPHGMTWNLVEIQEGEPTRAGTTRFLRDSSNPGVRFAFAGPVTGAFNLRVEKDDGTTHLLTVDRPEANQVYPFDARRLPPGAAAVVLEYVDAGQVWFTERKAINTGKITLRIDPERQLVYDEQGKPKVEGTIGIRADGPVPPFELTWEYEIAIPRGAAPLHVGWQTAQGTLSHTVEGVDTVPIEIPFSLPLEDFAVVPKAGEIFVTMTPAADVDVEVARENWNHFVVGERQAAFPRVGEYTVLRGDFHIHTTELEGVLTPSERVWEAYMYGYDTIALTDHRSIRAYDQAIGAAETLGMPLIRGMETGIDKREHFVVLDMDAEYNPSDEHRWSVDPNGPTVYYQEKVREIINHGGMIVYAHPGGEFVAPPPYDHPDGVYGWSPEVAWMVENGYIQGVDVRAHHSPDRRDAPFRWVLEYGLTMFDVSDVHGLRNMSAGSTAPLTLVFVDEVSREGVMDALRNGRTLVWRKGELRGAEEWLAPFFGSIIDVSVVDQAGQARLRIENRGAMRLIGRVQTDGSTRTQSVHLPPYESVDLELDIDPDTQRVDITWTNVWSAPDVLFQTTHALGE